MIPVTVLAALAAVSLYARRRARTESERNLERRYGLRP